MSLSQEAWKSQTYRKLQEVGGWLKQGDAPYLAYGTVAGLSLWPLVAAAVLTYEEPMLSVVIDVDVLTHAGHADGGMVILATRRKGN